MEKHKLIPLSAPLYHRYHSFFLDSDICYGSDDSMYVYEKSLLLVIKIDVELQKLLALIESGKYIPDNG